MLKVGIYTLGCKVSLYESQAIAERFESLGFEICDFEAVCDVYVINTCTVTAESDAKSRKYIRKAVRRNPSAVVLVCGCYSQRSPDEVMNIDGVCAVVGTENKMRLADIALEFIRGRERTDKLCITTDVRKAVFEPMCIKHAPRTRAYVKIEDGCESRCSYCAISDARGRVRSKPMDEVISEVEGLYRSGSREIVLTGIETGSWGKDLEGNIGLADLIAELDRRHSCERIRLGSLAPELVDEAFIAKVRDKKILAPHFHLSLQSGSDSVLRAMRRRYTSGRAMATIEALRAAIPSAMFTTDIMVGFPNESEADFDMTLDFVRRAGFLDVHVFQYSRRRGTPAAEYDGQISPQLKKARSERLIRLKNEVRDGVLLDFVERKEPLSVILESESCGYITAHSDSYVEVKIKSDAHTSSRLGDMALVHPVSHNDGVIFAEIIKFL